MIQIAEKYVSFTSENNSVRILDAKGEILTLVDSDGNKNSTIIGGESFMAISYSTDTSTVFLHYDDTDTNTSIVGIASGTSVITLDGNDNLKITVDATKGSFDFNATEGNNGIKMTVGSNDVILNKGAATYTASDITFPAGELVATLQKAPYASILGTVSATIPSGGNLSYSIESETISANVSEIALNFSDAQVIGEASIKGKISYDEKEKILTLAKDANISSDKIAKGSSTATDFEISALADSVIELDGSGLNASVIVKDGSKVKVSGESFGISGEFDVTGGELTLGNLDQLVTNDGIKNYELSSGTTLVLTPESSTALTVVAQDSLATIARSETTLTIGTAGTNGFDAKFGIISLNVKGDLDFDIDKQSLTIDQDATATINSDTIITAGKNGVALTASNTVITAATTDEAMTVQLGEMTADINGKINLGTKTSITALKDSVVTVGQAQATITADKGAVLTFTDTAIAFAADGSNTVTVSLNGSEFEVSGGFDLHSDTTLTVNQNAIVTSDSAILKVTDAKGGVISANADGISFAPTSDTGTIELTISDGKNTFTSALQVKGSVTYDTKGNITLAEGAVISDDSVTITSNAANGKVVLDPENGLTVKDFAKDTMTVALKDSFSFNELTGSAVFSDTAVTLDANTKFAGKLGDTEYNVESKDGTSTAVFDSNIIFTPGNDSTTMVVEIGDSDTWTITGGSLTASDTAVTIGVGATVDAGIEQAATLDKIGIYVLNGNDINTEAEGVEVKLTDGNAIEFDASAAIVSDKLKFGGTAGNTIKLANDTETSLIVYTAGKATLDSTEFSYNESGSTEGITVSSADKGFKVASVESGSVLTETFAITGASETAVKDYSVVLANDGVYTIEGISSGTKITAQAEGQGSESGTFVYVITNGDGDFTFGDKTYTISSDTSVVLGAHILNDNTVNLYDIGELDGEISGKLDGEVAINDAKFDINNNKSEVTVEASEETFFIDGITNASSISFTSSKVTVQTDGQEMTVNGVTYKTTDDKEGFQVSGNNEVFGLDPSAYLTISEDGTYIVNNTQLKVTANDTIVGASENYAYLYKEGVANFASDTSSDAVLADLGIDTANVVDPDENGNIPPLKEGEAAVVYKDTDSDKELTISMSDKGNAAIVQETEAPVTITGGAGDDTVVNQGGDDVVFNMGKGGKDQIIPTKGKVTLENYHPESGAGIQLTPDDVQKGIVLSDDGVKVAAEGSNTESDWEVEMDNNFVNLFMPDGTEEKIGFASAGNKELDYSYSEDNLVLIGGGKYQNIELEDEVGGSVLKSGKGNDSIFAGEGDTLDAGTGNNYVQMSDKGDSTLQFTQGRTTVDNFNFVEDGQDATDKIDMSDISISSVSFDGDALVLKTSTGKLQIEGAENKDITIENEQFGGEKVAQFGKTTLKMDDEATIYWATGQDATVSTDGYTGDGEFDLSNSDLSSKDKPVFVGKIREFNAETYKDEATITGNDKNNVLRAGQGGSTLNGGKGNDTLYGGKDVSDEFIIGEGNDVIVDFEMGGNNADVINSSDIAITSVSVNGEDVVLKTSNGKSSNTTIKDAVGKTIKFSNKYTEDQPIDAQISATELKVNDEAKFYWAAGRNASVSMDGYTGSGEFDLSNANFNDDGKLSFYGDIKELDAKGYAGESTITGNDKNNILKASDKGSELWGGNIGNDTLFGGDGEDTFIYKEGNGRDVIKDAKDNDTVVLEGMSLSDLVENDVALFSGSDIKAKFKDGGTLTVENALDSGVQFEIDGKTYAINKDTHKWEFK